MLVCGNPYEFIQILDTGHVNLLYLNQEAEVEPFLPYLADRSIIASRHQLEMDRDVVEIEFSDGTVYLYGTVEKENGVDCSEWLIDSYDARELVIKLASDRDDIVMDPFAGDCTTMIAAIKSSRQCLCIEEDEELVAAGRQKLESIFTGVVWNED